MTRNAAAYEELLKGDGYVREARADLVQRAIDHYFRATQLDESSAVTWVALARAYMQATVHLPQEASEWTRLATEAADRARALRPDAPWVLMWDAERNIERGAWSNAAAFYDEQLPVLPPELGGYARLWAEKGSLLTLVGRVREAISFLERARSTDPLSPLRREIERKSNVESQLCGHRPRPTNMFEWLGISTTPRVPQESFAISWPRSRQRPTSLLY